MAQIRSGNVGDELTFGRLAAASPLAREVEQPEEEQRDGDETPENERQED